MDDPTTPPQKHADHLETDAVKETQDEESPSPLSKRKPPTGLNLVLPVVNAPVFTRPPRPPRRSLPPIQFPPVISESATETEAAGTLSNSSSKEGLRYASDASSYHTAQPEEEESTILAKEVDKGLPVTPLTSSPPETPTIFTGTLDSLQEFPLPPVHPAERQAQKRQRCIQELVQTEISYSNDLKVVVLVYLERARGTNTARIQLSLAAETSLRSAAAQANISPMPISIQSPVLSPPVALQSPVQSPQTPKRLSRDSYFANTPPASPLIPTLSPGSPISRQSSTVTTDSSSSTKAKRRYSYVSPRILDEIDIATVFVNSKELADFSSSFASSLQQASENKQRSDSIGRCFLDNAPKINTLYGQYIAKHSAALRRLEELEASNELRWENYTQESAMLARPYTSSWNLNALLIKPVQRCLKYPLLLEAIIQNTPEAHPDLESLHKALAGLKETVRTFNEARRARELVARIVNKQRKSSVSSLTMRENSSSDTLTASPMTPSKSRSPLVTKASPPTSFKQNFAKQISRSGIKIKTAAGFRPKESDAFTETAALENLLRRFIAQERALNQFLLFASRYISSYDQALEQLRNTIWSWIDTIAPLPGEAEIVGGPFNQLLQFGKLMRRLQTGPLMQARTWIENSLQPAIKKILNAFAGPQAVIDKRKVRQIDIQRSSHKRSASLGNDDLDYVALSVTLCRELPVFLETIATFFNHSVCAWARVQSSMHKTVHSALSDFESDFGVPISDNQSIIEAWKQSHGAVSDAIINLSCVSPGRMNMQIDRNLRSRRGQNDEEYGKYFADSPVAPSYTDRTSTVHPEAQITPAELTEVLPPHPPPRRHFSQASMANRSSLGSTTSFNFSIPSRTSTVPSSIGADTDGLPVLFAAVAIDNIVVAQPPSTKDQEKEESVSVDCGEEVDVLSEEGEWYLVRKASGEHAYIPTKHLLGMRR